MIKQDFASDTLQIEDTTTNFLLESQPNFRDLGGYVNQKNKKIKTGLIFRSGQLDNLTSKDIQTLNDINLHTNVDFRSEQEIANKKNELPISITEVVELCINPGNLSFDNLQQIISQGNAKAADQFLMSINQQLVLDNQAQYRAFFELLQYDHSMPMVFNCTAGKDRTGFAAALFLSAMDVNRELIYNDYLQTNKRVQTTIKSIIEEHNLKQPDQIQTIINLMSVKKGYLQCAFDTITQHYTSIENYLHTILNVDIALLQRKYLED
ncbi:tyrosine-protein phosphatase [Myroides sp. LJL115]